MQVCALSCGVCSSKNINNVSSTTSRTCTPNICVVLLSGQAKGGSALVHRLLLCNYIQATVDLSQNTTKHECMNSFMLKYGFRDLFRGKGAREANLAQIHPLGIHLGPAQRQRIPS